MCVCLALAAVSELRFESIISLQIRRQLGLKYRLCPRLYVRHAKHACCKPFNESVPVSLAAWPIGTINSAQKSMKTA